MWATLIKHYWQVSTFRRNPANTPYSLVLLIAISVFYCLLITVQWQTVEVARPLSFLHALGVGLLLVLSYALYTYLLLSLFHVRVRVVQTLSCLLAGHAIVHLFAFPLLLLAPWLAEKSISQPLGLLLGILYLIITLVLTAWQFMIAAYIYKQALGVDYLPALLASVGLLAINVLTVSLGQ